MTVYLVGAGPADPGLITVRGADAPARAVVVYDRLASVALLDLVPPNAELISAAKAPGQVELTQHEINALLVERGRAGATVVRLKGRRPVRVRPRWRGSRGARGGRSAVRGRARHHQRDRASAYAGIPVTHRGVSTHFTVVTGHEDRTKEQTDVDWAALARVGGTVVTLMGAGNVGEIAQCLIDGGRDPATPVAAVRNGSRADQQTLRATLATIGGAGVRAPSAIVVGDVAALDLSWFESRPLFGRSVVVTRARQQASELRARRVPWRGGGARSRLGIVWRLRASLPRTNAMPRRSRVLVRR